MKCNFEVEINGITSIVINGILFARGMDRNWTNTVTNKVVLDAHMWARVKRMMHKTHIMDDTFTLRTGERRNFGYYVPHFRAWVNTNSLNIEKIHYD